MAGGYIDTLVMYAFFRYDLGAIRLNYNGTLDNTFGTAGIVRADKGSTDVAYATKRLSDGRIVMAGVSNYYTNNRFTALCLMPDGSIDNTFGTDGWLFLDFYGGSAFCEAMAVEPDDDIILGGSSSSYVGGVSTSSIALAKFSSSGIPDNTFGFEGLDTSFTGTTYKNCNSIALQADSKIVTAGYIYGDAYSSFLTARYTNSVFLRWDEYLHGDFSNFIVYPNPIYGDVLSLNYEIANEGNIRFELIDMNGVIMYAENTGYHMPGIFNETIKLPEGMPSGNYFLRIENGLSSLTQKIMVVK